MPRYVHTGNMCNAWSMHSAGSSMAFMLLGKAKCVEGAEIYMQGFGLCFYWCQCAYAGIYVTTKNKDFKTDQSSHQNKCWQCMFLYLIDWYLKRHDRWWYSWCFWILKVVFPLTSDVKQKMFISTLQQSLLFFMVPLHQPPSLSPSRENRLLPPVKGVRLTHTSLHVPKGCVLKGLHLCTTCP